MLVAKMFSLALVYHPVSLPLIIKHLNPSTELRLCHFLNFRKAHSVE